MRCFVVVMQSFIMNSHEVSIHIHQGCFAGTGAIVRLPQCQWSKPDGYGKISQCITTTKHSKAVTVCIFLGIYCSIHPDERALASVTINNGLEGNWSKRRQTETSTDPNVDKPKRRQTKTSTHQNIDTPKRRQTETSILYFIILYAMV